LLSDPEPVTRPGRPLAPQGGRRGHGDHLTAGPILPAKYQAEGAKVLQAETREVRHGACVGCRDDPVMRLANAVTKPGPRRKVLADRAVGLPAQALRRPAVEADDTGILATLLAIGRAAIARVKSSQDGSPVCNPPLRVIVTGP
jgi:hypothetical protein